MLRLSWLCMLVMLPVAWFVPSSEGFKLAPTTAWTRSSVTQQSSTTRKINLSMMAEFNWKQVKKTNEEKMNKCLESVQSQFNTVRAGGANAAILDRVYVDYFGSKTPLTQLARISTSGSQQLVVEPFERSSLKEIEKAIATADLNLTPNNDGNVVRINIPPLTEDRRKEMTKLAKTMCEDGKIALRNVRRDFVEKIKAAEKDKSISKDDSKGFQVSFSILLLTILIR